jgi:hypothetical protein
MRAILAVCAVGLAAAHLSAGQEVAPAGLERLTVPEARLPEGCRLSVLPKTSSGRSMVDISPFEPRLALFVDANPWIAERTSMVVFVDQIVNGGTTPAAYAALTRSELMEQARRRAAWRRGVSGVYRAEYMSAGMSTRVHAMRFMTPESAAAVSVSGPLPAFAAGTSARLVIGRDIARVSAPAGPNACYDAVRRHLESLR